MKITVVVDGGAEAIRGLRGSVLTVLAASKAALRAEHEAVMTVAKTRTPVDTGTLRASGHVQATTDEGGVLQSVGGFGGAAESYAIYVHENLRARHRVGQAKFYESALLDAENGMAERLAGRVKQELGR